MPQRKNPLAQSSARPEFVIVPMLMTAKEASAYVGLNLYLLYRLTSAREITAVTWGKSNKMLRWRKADLDAWLADLPAADGPVRSPRSRRSPDDAA